jgi:hypothetical protein
MKQKQRDLKFRRKNRGYQPLSIKQRECQALFFSKFQQFSTAQI